jgi:hypothetical protein
MLDDAVLTGFRNAERWVTERCVFERRRCERCGAERGERVHVAAVGAGDARR